MPDTTSHGHTVDTASGDVSSAADIPTGPEPRTLEVLEEAEEEAEEDRAHRGHA